MSAMTCTTLPQMQAEDSEGAEVAAGTVPARCPPLTAAVRSAASPPQQLQLQSQSSAPLALQWLPSPLALPASSDRHVRQKVGDDSVSVSPAASPARLAAAPMPIGATPERGRAAGSKTPTKAHSPPSSRSVSPARTRAVRSAIGKAVIGDNGAATTSRPFKPTAAASGASGGQLAEVPKFGSQKPGSGERESRRLGLPASGSSSPLSPESGRSGDSRASSASPFGSLASSDGHRHGHGDANGSSLQRHSSSSVSSDSGQPSSGRLRGGGGSGSLMNGSIIPTASTGRGAASSIVGSLPGEGGDPLGPVSQSFASQFSEHAHRGSEEVPFGARTDSSATPSPASSHGGSPDRLRSGYPASPMGLREEHDPALDPIDAMMQGMAGMPMSPRESLPLKRPAPEVSSPTVSDGSVGASIGDHISAARSAFSAGGSISFGLNSGKASSSADNATSMDRTASQDTALSPLSRPPGFPTDTDAAPTDRPTADPSVKAPVVSGSAALVATAVEGTVLEETADSSFNIEQGSPAEGSATIAVAEVFRHSGTSQGAVDATVHSLELARLQLTQESSDNSRSASPAVDMTTRSGNGGSQGANGSGPHTSGWVEPSSSNSSRVGSNLAVQEFTRAGLLARIKAKPADFAVRAVSQEKGGREGRDKGDGELPSPLARQQERRQLHLQGKRAGTVRCLSDPLNSRASRREAVAAALASQAKAAESSPAAQQPTQQTDLLHASSLTAPTDNVRSMHRAGPEQQHQQAGAGGDADVGVSLSRLLQLQDYTGGLPAGYPAHPVRRSLGLTIPSQFQHHDQQHSFAAVAAASAEAAAALRHASSAPEPGSVQLHLQPLELQPFDVDSMHASPTRADTDEAGDSQDGPSAADPIPTSIPGDGRHSSSAAAPSESSSAMVDALSSPEGCSLAMESPSPPFDEIEPLTGAPGDEGQESSRQRQALARLLAARGRTTEALAALEPLLLAHPAHADLLCLRGNCLAAAGNNVGAFASFASALAADGRHTETLISCGRLYKGCGLLAESLESYRIAQSIDPHSEDIARALAVVLTDLGTQLKIAGNVEEGMTYYLEAIEVCPTYAAAYYNVAVVHSEAGRADQAVAQYKAALSASPAYAEAWCNLGVIHKNQGRLVEAVDAYERALAAAPNFEIVRNNLAIALTELGTRTKMEGDIAEGIRIYERALAYNPQYPDALYNLGVACGEVGLTDRAIFAYEMAAALNPACAEALNNLGVLHRERGNLERASHCYTAALQIRPNFPQGLNNLAVVCTAQGRVAEALQLLQGALLAAPDYAEAHNNLGVLQRDVGAVPDAIASYERCLDLAPDSRNAGQNRLLALNYIHQGEERLVCSAHEAWGERFHAQFTPLPPLPPPPRPRHATPLSDVSAHENKCRSGIPSATTAPLDINGTAGGPPIPPAQLAAAAVKLKQQDPGHMKLQQHDQQQQLGPHTGQQQLNSRIQSNSQRGQQQGSIDALMRQAETPAGVEIRPALDRATLDRPPLDAQAALESPVDRTPTSSPDSVLPSLSKQSSLSCPPACDDEPIFAAERRNGGGMSGALSDVEPHQLTVGYLSPDLFTHSVSYFAEAPLRHHDSSSVSVIVYSCVAKGDSKTEMLRAAVESAGGTWRDVASLSEAQVAAAVRRDGVDILVELTGHTASNRLGVMAMRPAPVQATWIGYPNSTGLQAVDYRFTDAVCDPLDTTQTFVEELVRLPGCFLCYTPAVDAPPVAPSPASDTGFVTFGSFNNLAKITPEVLKVWARILRAVPDSRLLLKNKPYACHSARAHTLSALQAHGISPLRVDLLPLAADTAEHLSTYAQMDVSLDPFPYAGTTTTCESLYMGVPCVTLAGKCHAHNVGVSLLTAIGGLTADWVAHSQDEYVDLAVAAAADVPRLAALRVQLRGRMMTSPLGAGRAFTRRLEGTYHALWDRYCTRAWQADDGTAGGR